MWDEMSSLARSLSSNVEMYAAEFEPRRVRRIAALLTAFPVPSPHIPLLPSRKRNLTLLPPLKQVSLQLHLNLQSPHVEDPEAELRRLFADLGGRLGAEIPRDVFVRALRSDDGLAAKIDLPTDIDEAAALDQLHFLRFGRVRPPQRSVGLDELAAYYNPLALERMLPGASQEQRSPLGITRDLLAVVKAVPYDEGRFTSRERLMFVGMVNKLQTCMGAAERIVQTPVPLHYVHYTSRFLSAWCFALPLCLVAEMGFFVAPLMGVVAWALFGLREIGVLIENPFRRCTQIQVTIHSIRTDVAALLATPLAVDAFPLADAACLLMRAEKSEQPAQYLQ